MGADWLTGELLDRTPQVPYRARPTGIARTLGSQPCEWVPLKKQGALDRYRPGRSLELSECLCKWLTHWGSRVLTRDTCGGVQRRSSYQVPVLGMRSLVNTLKLG